MPHEWNRKIEFGYDFRFGIIPREWLKSYAKNKISQPELIVLLALSTFWCGKEYCWPTLKQIADLTRIRKDHVREHLVSLRNKNIIAIYNEDDLPEEAEGVLEAYRLLLV